MCCVGSDETDVGTLNDCDRSVSWTSGFKSALRMTECWLMLSTLIRIASTWCAYVTSHSTSANLLTGYLLLCALRSLPPLRLFALWYLSARCLFHKLCVHDKSHQADIDMFTKCFSIICYYSNLILSQRFFSVTELKSCKTYYVLFIKRQVLFFTPN